MSGGFVIHDFQCPDHGIFEDMVPRSYVVSPCPVCGVDCDWVLSAVRVSVKISEPVSRGKSDPHGPNMLDTRPLADGMPVAEWRKKNVDRLNDMSMTRNRKKMGLERKVISDGGARK